MGRLALRNQQEHWFLGFLTIKNGCSVVAAEVVLEIEGAHARSHFAVRLFPSPRIDEAVRLHFNGFLSCYQQAVCLMAVAKGTDV